MWNICLNWNIWNEWWANNISFWSKRDKKVLCNCIIGNLIRQIPIMRIVTPYEIWVWETSLVRTTLLSQSFCLHWRVWFYFCIITATKTGTRGPQKQPLLWGRWCKFWDQEKPLRLFVWNGRTEAGPQSGKVQVEFKGGRERNQEKRRTYQAIFTHGIKNQTEQTDQKTTD